MAFSPSQSNDMYISDIINPKVDLEENIYLRTYKFIILQYFVEIFKDLAKFLVIFLRISYSFTKLRN